MDLVRSKYSENKPFPESKFYLVDGARLHVRQWEPDKNSVSEPKGIVYLVHGLSGSTYNWRFLVPQLVEAGWNVLTVDIPPFGFSGEKQPNSKAFDPLSPDSMSRAKLLWDLFDNLNSNYSGKVVVVGHSLGGRVASYMVLSRPTKVSSLVLLAPAVFGTSAVPDIASYWPINEVISSSAKPVLQNLDAVHTVVDIAYGRKATDEEVFGNIAPFLREGASEACGDWISKATEKSLVPLGNIKVSTLILWSKGDVVVPNKGKELQEIIKGSKYFEITGSSHCIMDTDSTIVLEKLLPFISGNDSSI